MAILTGARHRFGPASFAGAARPDRAKAGIVLVSANFGGIDAIKPFPRLPGVDTLFYTDAAALADADPEVVASWGKIIAPDYPRHDFTPRLRAKYFKLQIHRLPDTQSYRWLAWADSSLQFRDPSFLLRETKRLARLAPHQRLTLLPHPDRHTVREEYEFCQQQIADGGEFSEYLRVRYAQEKMTEQMNFFASRGWNLDAPLWCGTIWLIENNDLIARCWDSWWDQNLRYGMQDQLSLPMMLDVFGLEPQALKLYVWKNDFWEHVTHRNLSERCSCLPAMPLHGHSETRVMEMQEHVRQLSTTTNARVALLGELRGDPDLMTLPEKRQAVENGMRVIYISGEPTTPGHRYRVVRAVAAATRTGVQATWMEIDEVPRRVAELRSAEVVVVWRVPWDHRLASALEAVRAQGATIVFDLDDLMIEPDLARPEVVDAIRSNNLAAEGIRDFYARMRQTMCAADLCVASTEELAQFMRLAGMPALAMPNTFDHSVLAVSRLAARHWSVTKPRDGSVRIGYATGTRTHQRDFSACVGAVAEVLRKHPECLLVLFREAGRTEALIDTNEFPELRGLESQIEWRRAVPLEELPAEIARFDINLAPLEVGNPYCESKSELKYFEAALVDVPTIASPTGPFRRAIRHRETGYLASTQREWSDILTSLVVNPEQRRRIAAAARRDVVWTFGPERRCGMIRELFDYVKGGSSAARSFQDSVRPQPAHPLPQVPEHDVLFNIDHLGSAKVTIAIPLYNYARFIGEALASAATQTLPDLDLVVVDDCSTDESLSVVFEWAKMHAERFNRISILRNRINSGLGLTRNVGFDASDTPFVLALDADNRLMPGCAAACLTAVEGTDAAFAYPVIREFGTDKGFKPIWPGGLMGAWPYDPVRLSQGNYIDAMALISKAAWSYVGGFDDVRTGWEDFDFWCSFAERGLRGVQIAGEPLAEYRVHGGSMDRTNSANPEKQRLRISRLQERHSWLKLTPPPAIDERKGVGTPSGRSADRLVRLLPILRCPESGTALSLAPDGDALLSDGGARRWPLVQGRPLLYPGMQDPAINADSHLSNDIPESALALIQRTRGMVLHLSAGGTSERFENVVELDAAVFRHTDVIGDAHRLPFVDGAFGAVISLNAFEHYRDPYQAAREIYRVLRPKGEVIIHTAFLQPLHEAPWHFYNCTRYGLENWLRDFEKDTLHVSDNFHVGFSLSWLASECELALRGRVSAAAARAFNATPIGRVIAMWRDPEQRDGDLMWKNFGLIPQEAQEVMAAGFEYIGRRPG